MAEVLHQRRISAPPDKVYAALTTADGVRAWWTRDAELDQAGGVFGFHGRRVVTKVTITELSPPTRVVWTVIASNAPGGWEGTTIAFDLAPDGAGGTSLIFSHSGFAAMNEGVERVTTGWGLYLDSLKALAETGQGAPHTG